MLELKNVSKKYDREVLKKINLKFGNKGFICLVGESGSGKTTLLNIIGKLEQPDSGKVIFNGNNIKNIDSSFYSNQLVSFINQNYNLIAKYTVLENILLPIELRRIRSPCNVDNILKMLGIYSLKNKKVISLSGGEKQRVAIARCIVQNTRVILADEPTGALDSENAYSVMRILKNLSKQKLVIVVTHNIELANSFADDIIKINDGKICSKLKVINKYSKIKYNRKIKLSFIKLVKYAIKNLNNKLLRNILTILAFTIGLLSLGIVISIKTGFNKELDSLNKSSFFNYPLVISKNNYVDDFSNKVENKNGVNVKKGSFVTNEIDDKLISLVNNIDKKYVNGITYYRDIDYEFKSISYVNPSNNYFYLVSGRMPENKNEVMILYDEEDSISDKLYNYLDVSNNGLINNIFKVNDKELIITGIVKSNNDYFKSLSGILYSNNLFDNEITDIYIYANNLNSKNKIKDLLKDYEIFDNAEEVVNLTKKMVDGISLVLILFSVISLIVSMIMIFVISYISVMERNKDIGIYKSIGFRNKDIKNLFIVENLIIGMCSFYLTMIFILLVSNVINKFVYSYINFEHIMSLDILNIILLFFLSLILCYVASFIPAKIASNKKIVDIFNN
mgnify:CR=1 FL=1